MEDNIARRVSDDIIKQFSKLLITFSLKQYNLGSIMNHKTVLWLVPTEDENKWKTVEKIYYNVLETDILWKKKVK